ncbi:hypothetical protein EYR40_009873 [Pleurotus pulmonarius]|nr:hypothetical protein EYR38_002919 [Pleurotus pulmonarius]KAF4591270.1 hypothetical protein EYR40_009873 [Pleurotus pulmonarius]
MPVINTSISNIFNSNPNAPRTPRTPLTPPPSYTLSTQPPPNLTPAAPSASITTTTTPAPSCAHPANPLAPPPRPPRPKLTLRLDSIPEYAPLSIVTPYTPSYASHPSQSQTYNSTQSHILTYNSRPPSSASYPSFTLNLGVEESPLGALTPLTPLTPMTPRTPGGRWFDPVQPQPIHAEPDSDAEGRGEADTENTTTYPSKNKSKNKGKQRAGEYLDGDCGICFEEAVAPTLTPCCRAVFCAEHLDEWLRGPESDGRCPACKKRVGLDFDVDLAFAGDDSRGNMQNDMQIKQLTKNDIQDRLSGEHFYGSGRGRGVETTSAWRWLASWLVPERTDDTSIPTSTALDPTHSTHHPDSTHKPDSASLDPAGVPVPAIPLNTSTSRGRYGSPYTPYPYSPLAGLGSGSGIGTPITPGTPPATQGFMPMAPSGVSGGRVHPLAAHVECGGGEGSEYEREKKKEGERVEEKDGEKEGEKDGERGESSSSSSSSASSRTNSCPEIAGEGSTSSACTTPPVPSLSLPTLPSLPTPPCPPAIVVDGVGDEEADATTTTATKSRPGAGEDVDVVGTLSRFLSLLGLLGLFYVLLS